jgi:hypothetical protein
MRKLLVYADLHWLHTPALVGELSYESLRGADSYGFSFAPTWLQTQRDLFLSADLNNYTGMQYTAADRDIFGCFSDALPDRWGRTLLNRREQLQAQEQRRPLRRLSSFDYLLGIDDYSRMGAFRFKETPDSDFINSDPTLKIPPLTDIRTLQEAGRAIEQSEAHNVLPEKKWIAQLIQPGTSLGGARPKASVTDLDGALCVAKFPSRSDDYDVELWEHLCHLLARKAGIEVADTKVLKAIGPYHTLISRRFDRTTDGGRIHFASAMTLLGLQDGNNAADGHGYLDLVDFIVQHCTAVESNLRELYRRVAFYICVGNSDDHFRNHGFLLTPKGWTLSPAYDINPTLNPAQSLLITSVSNQAAFSQLRAAAEDYLLTRETADAILDEVQAALQDWPTLAAQIGIPRREIAQFADRWSLAQTL